jgi:hypothetical protein
MTTTLTPASALTALKAGALLPLSSFVGAGLMFADVTGWSGVATLLRALPWNRRAEA